MRYDPYNHVKHIHTMVPASKAAATYIQTAVDISGFDYYLAKLHLGAITAGGSLTFKLQESDDNSTFVDIANATVTIADTGGDKLYMHRLDARLRSRYVRIHLVVTAQPAIAGLSEELSVPYELPTTQPASTLKSSTIDVA